MRGMEQGVVEEEGAVPIITGLDWLAGVGSLNGTWDCMSSAIKPPLAGGEWQCVPILQPIPDRGLHKFSLL